MNMPYQLSELVADVRTRAKDTTFDSDLITDYIQATQNEVLHRSRFPFMQLSDTDTVSADSTDYQLDEEVDTILSLKLIDTTTDQVVEPEFVPYPQFFERFDPEQSSAGTPIHYTVYGDTVIWDVPLHQAWQLSIRYIKTPSVLSIDSDVPDIPERFKELLIRGALAGVEEYRDNYDIAALHQRKVEDLTEDMLNRLTIRQLATAPRSRFGRRSSYGEW